MPTIRTVAMPGDTNPAGDIFGGWLLSQMDVGGAVLAIERARGRVATIAVDGMTFERPVYVGDLVSVYAELVRVGRTSLTILVEAWARRNRDGDEVKVTAGRFTYVAIDERRQPRHVPTDI
jgi:acyl-CoA thioesterase YciA